MRRVKWKQVRADLWEVAQMPPFVVVWAVPLIIGWAWWEGAKALDKFARSIPTRYLEEVPE